MDKMVEMTRKLEFDAGHRIPDHGSKCRNLHGHRYVLEVTLQGYVNHVPGQEDTGMIIDFGALKTIMNQMVCDVWDHAFLVYEHDHAVRMFLETMPEHKTVVLDRVPTAENLAQIAFDTLFTQFGQTLFHVRLYETPNCWADIYRD